VSIVLVLLLFVLAGAAIVYPLLPGRGPQPEAPAVADAEIEQAVRELRRTRGQEGHHCTACGQSYQAGDRFCVRCGGELPVADARPSSPVCPACGAAVREGDEFCAKCGRSLGSGEAA
jgi:predicted amidophosphoribosyltransferase